jgi:hypothetical protein
MYSNLLKEYCISRLWLFGSSNEAVELLVTGNLMIYLGRMYKTSVVTYFKAQTQDVDEDSRKAMKSVKNDKVFLGWIAAGSF